jgi:hypothetical protein
MSINNLLKSIDSQIKLNQDKNLFHKNNELFRFSNETINNISSFNELNDHSEQLLIDYTTNKTIEEFCRINQYYSFNSKTKEELKAIYSDLLKNIQNKSFTVEEITRIHFEKLKKWLEESNPFAKRIYSNDTEKVKPVACFEYSLELQVNTLKIDIKQLIQPVLDIGCGNQGKLVNYLKNNGIDAYGIDRFNFKSTDLDTADWLEYDYEENKWGTIVSNLGFSNHFTHHNLRIDGNYIEYAKKYMDILRSLKVRGSFHYAPDLPFIEKFLDKNQFSIKHYKINNYDLKTTVITKLRE